MLLRIKRMKVKDTYKNENDKSEDIIEEDSKDEESTVKDENDPSKSGSAALPHAMMMKMLLRMRTIFLSLALRSFAT